jgi:hypothetical protein
VELTELEGIKKLPEGAEIIAILKY